MPRPLDCLPTSTTGLSGHLKCCCVIAGAETSRLFLTSEFFSMAGTRWNQSFRLALFSFKLRSLLKPLFKTSKKLLDCIPLDVPLERFIFHFLFDVPFPSPERPRILAQFSGEEKVALFYPQRTGFATVWSLIQEHAPQPGP